MILMTLIMLMILMILIILMISHTPGLRHKIPVFSDPAPGKS